MSELELGRGLCLGYGGTNARAAQYDQGEIYGFNTEATPSDPDLFFGWMARKLLDAAHDDQVVWAVGGYPGPVSPDGKIVGPMENVNGLKKQKYDIAEKLVKADPASADLFDEGFVLLNVNDGELAAHAVAAKKAKGTHNIIGALIIGTGQGTGVVRRDPHATTIFRADRQNPYETGHLPLDLLNPDDSFEKRISGPAIANRTGIDPREIPASHPIWREVGGRAGQLATFLGLMGGVELIVPTGGVGAGSSDKYKDHMEKFLNTVREYGNGPQKMFVPDVDYIDPKDAQVFELFGAGGVMADFLSRDPQAA